MRFHFDLADQARDRYPQLPIEVDGPFTVRLHITGGDSSPADPTQLRPHGAAAIDLGLVGPDLDGRGSWRGWSGGARTEFTIGAATATPGYLPGVESGTWSVVLGLHQVPSDGVAVDIEVSPAAPLPPPPVRPPAVASVRGSARDLPAPPGLRWWAGDFHAHTLHSDGDQSVDQLAAAAAARGLDFLAITDHNTTSHWAELSAAGQRYGIALLPGQEVTTHRGHANAFGEVGFVDFREPAARWIEHVDRAGGVLSANHPLSRDCAWLVPELPAVVELWHIEWFLGLHHTAPWTLLQRWPAGTPVLGGSDFHTPSQGYPPGTPTTWVLAEDCTTDALLAGVRQGRTAISRFPTPDCPVLLRIEDQLWAIDADGCIQVDEEGRRRIIHGDRVRLPAPAGRCRLEAADRGLLAIA